MTARRAARRAAPLGLALAALSVAGAAALASTVGTGPRLLDRGDFEARATGLVPQAGHAYPYLRCAALFRALRLYARERDAAAGLALAQPTPGERQMIEEAVEARMAQAGTARRSAGLQVEADISDLAALYTARFEVRADADAERWWDDRLVETDLRACGLLLQSLTDGGAVPAR